MAYFQKITIFEKISVVFCFFEFPGICLFLEKMVKISSVVHQNDREDHGYPPRGCATSAAAAIGDRGRKTEKILTKFDEQF